MRKHISIQPESDKSQSGKFSIKKVLTIAILFVLLMGTVGVMASSNRVRSVKILLSSGYEMNVVTTSTKVEDILKENHIIVFDGESVTPDVKSDLSDNSTITIKKGESVTIAQEQEFSPEEILKSYQSVIEKIVTEKVEIPFKTTTKEVANGSQNTQNQVVQAGVNGIKEILVQEAGEESIDKYCDEFRTLILMPQIEAYNSVQVAEQKKSSENN